MKLTVLAENTTWREDVGCEHGLSLYIETGGHKILFDMGQTELFAENAERLGVRLEEVDFAVLSHGHYDHGGGLRRFLELNQTAPVYLSRYAFEPHYNGTEKYIGLAQELAQNERLVFVGEEYKIAEGLTLYACNERTKKVPLDCGGLMMEQDGALQPEDFRHEQYLLIEENGRRILVSGCSHKGIINITDWFRPDVLIGGFHFMKMPCGEQLKAHAEQLNAFPTEFYTCHCTGLEQYDFMKQYMKSLHYLSSGTIAEIK